MKQHTNTTGTSASPATTMKEARTITVDLDALKPNPARVKSERTTGAILGIVIGGLVGALGGLLLGKKRPENKTFIVTAGVVACAAIGGVWGKSGKTEEEERSAVLIKAANSDNFGEAIKKEMKRREDDAYWRGNSVG